MRVVGTMTVWRAIRPMAIVIAGGVLSAITLLPLVVRPWELPVDTPDPMPAVAH